jgi:hypothetical protein
LLLFGRFHRFLVWCVSNLQFAGSRSRHSSRRVRTTRPTPLGSVAARYYRSKVMSFVKPSEPLQQLLMTQAVPARFENRELLWSDTSRHENCRTRQYSGNVRQLVSVNRHAISPMALGRPGAQIDSHHSSASGRSRRRMIAEPERALEPPKEIAFRRSCTSVHVKAIRRDSKEKPQYRSHRSRGFPLVAARQKEVPPPNLNCWTVSYFPLVRGIA